jgi:uncharacterized protein involved in response to NO
MPRLPAAIRYKNMPGQPWTLLNYAFRPFFLFSALYAILAIGLWIVALRGVVWSPPGPDPILWHAHEMLFGFALSAAAGFLLSAVSTWTNRPQICGTPLGVLAATWLVGRAAMLGAAALPDGLVALADLSFPVLFAAFAAREILGGRSQRNYGIAAVIAGIALLDLVFHLGRSGIWPAADRVAIILAVHLFLTLITIIGGRIVPTFTTNWLRLRGSTSMPIVRPKLDRILLPVMLIAGLADGLLTVTGLPPAAAGALAIAAAAVHAIRLSGWRGTATGAEPLLAVLHVGYAWIPIGYLLLGLAGLGLPLPKPAILHALTMGGIGAVILAVTTRVALGHTARPLTATPLTTAAYVFLNAAVLIRLISAVAPNAYQVLIDIAATSWMTAFVLYLWVYWPMLTQPRTDGRPERRTAA